jgi:hypothetical protein
MPFDVCYSDGLGHCPRQGSLAVWFKQKGYCEVIAKTGDEGKGTERGRAEHLSRQK